MTSNRRDSERPRSSVPSGDHTAPVSQSKCRKLTAVRLKSIAPTRIGR